VQARTAVLEVLPPARHRQDARRLPRAARTLALAVGQSFHFQRVQCFATVVGKISLTTANLVPCATRRLSLSQYHEGRHAYTR